MSSCFYCKMLLMRLIWWQYGSINMFCKAWKLRRKQSFHSGGLLPLNPLHCVASTSIQLIQCNTEQILAATFPMFGQHAWKNYESVFAGLSLSSQVAIWEFILWINATGLLEEENVCCPLSSCVRVRVRVCDQVQVGHGITHWWTWATSSEGRQTGTCVWLTWDIQEGEFWEVILLIFDIYNTNDKWSGCDQINSETFTCIAIHLSFLVNSQITLMRSKRCIEAPFSSYTAWKLVRIDCIHSKVLDKCYMLFSYTYYCMC